MHEFRELSSVAFRTLEEQLYQKKAQMKRQATQHAAILVPGNNVELGKVPTLQEFAIDPHRVEEFKETCFKKAGCFKTPHEAEREVRQIEERLVLGEVIEGEVLPAKEDDDEVPLE